MKKTILLLILSISSLFAFSQLTKQLTGTGTDADGTITGYTWRVISGPAQPVFNNPNISNPTITFNVAGIYKIGLITTDNVGAKSVEDTLTANIHAANIRPKANAGPDIEDTLPTVMIKTIDINKGIAWVKQQ